MPAWESRENWSRREIEVYQLERLNEIWRHARRYVPYYRQLAGSRSLPEQFADLAEFRLTVPILLKNQIAEHGDAFLSEIAPRGSWHCTSGSTGIPLRAYRSHQDHREMLRARYRFQSMWGHDVFDRMVWIWGTDGGNAAGLAGRLARARNRLHDGLRGRLRLPASQLGRDDLRGYLRQMGAFRPSAICGYSRAVYLLALEAAATGFQCDGIRFVILTGEAAAPRIVETVSQAFQAPAIIEYGSVECGFVAGEWPDRTLRVREDIVIAETLPRSDGLFDIVLTMLTNRSFPLIRYQIGDLTSAPLEMPQRGFSILKNVAGRSDDLLVSKQGRCVHAASVDEFFERESTLAVRCYRVHQNCDGSIQAMVQLKQPHLRMDTSAIERGIARLVDGFPVEVRLVDAIPPAATGKHRLVTSDLQPEHSHL
jgi:phenylacetate-CoA ligase